MSESERFPETRTETRRIVIHTHDGTEFAVEYTITTSQQEDGGLDHDEKTAIEKDGKRIILGNARFKNYSEANELIKALRQLHTTSDDSE